MGHCLLTQKNQRSLVRLSFLAILNTAGCAKDPILEAAESMDTLTDSKDLESKFDKDRMVGVPEEPEPGIPGEPDQEMKAGLASDPEPGTPEEPEPGIPEDPEPAAPGTESQPAPPTSGDGVPTQPEPGIPDEPKPAPPGTPGGADHPGKEGGLVDDGPHVTIRGTISANSANGKIRIDLFDGDQRKVSGPRPKVVGVHDIGQLGPYEVSVPLSVGRVWLGAYLDANGNNRPDKGEAFGWYGQNPVHLDDVPKAVNIALVEEGKATGLGLDFGE